MANAGQPDEDGLHGRADGARVGHVVAQVGPVVDARGDEVEADLEVAQEGEAHRVGRRAVHGPAGRAVVEDALPDPQRAHEGHRVAHRRLVRLRGQDVDVADGLEGLLEREQAARFDAVVVGDEDARPGRPVRQRPRPAGRGPRGRPRRGQVAVAAGQRAPCPAPAMPAGSRVLAEPHRQARRGGACAHALFTVTGGSWPGSRDASASLELVVLPVPGVPRRPARSPLPEAARRGRRRCGRCRRQAHPAGEVTGGGAGTRTGRPWRASRRRAARLVTSRGPPFERLR